MFDDFEKTYIKAAMSAAYVQGELDFKNGDKSHLSDVLSEWVESDNLYKIHKSITEKSGRFSEKEVTE